MSVVSKPAFGNSTARSKFRPQDPKQVLSYLFRDFIEQMTAGFFITPGTCVVW